MMLGRVLKQLLRRSTKVCVADFLPRWTEPKLNEVFNFFWPVFWFTRDKEAVSAAAQTLVLNADGGHYFGDNLLTWGKSLSMLDDQPFVIAWRANIESPSDEAIVWRRYVLACAAYHCMQLPGDFVECGAYTGVGIKTVVDYLGGIRFPKVFWGYDAFDHDESMENHSMPAHSDKLFQRVSDKFAKYPQVRLVPGQIPASFVGAAPEKIAYLHIDLNQATAEVAALEHLFDRVVPGGIVILDDYDWVCYRKQKLAEDAWFEARKYRVMPLPTGQGLIVKR